MGLKAGQVPSYAEYTYEFVSLLTLYQGKYLKLLCVNPHLR